MKTLNIFRAGRHTDRTGGTRNFTAEDLAAIAKGYDPAKHDAPIVVGHPSHDAPAYGWIKKLTLTNDGLEAKPDQVDPEFATLVEKGRYKKISASFFAPDSPANPTPGKWYLRHVGFLGAAAPAVPGLRQASFSENDDGVVEFETPTDDYRWTTLTQAFRRLREFIVEKYGVQTADNAVPDYFIDTLSSPPDVPAAFAENQIKTKQEKQEMTPENLKKKEDEIAEREAALAKKEAQFAESAKKAEKDAEAKKNAEFSEREAELEKREAELAKREHADFVESLVKNGQVLPREKAFFIEFMSRLDDETTVEFSENEKGETKTGGLLSLFRDSLKNRPKLVDFSERSADDGSGDDVDAEAKAIAGTI